MTNQEVIAIYNRMLEIFGTLPNPDHEPKQFEYLYKLYKYYHTIR